MKDSKYFRDRLSYALQDQQELEQNIAANGDKLADRYMENRVETMLGLFALMLWLEQDSAAQIRERSDKELIGMRDWAHLGFRVVLQRMMATVNERERSE